MDKNAFRHEFFVRLARAFPFLQNLSVSNLKPTSWTWYRDENDWYSMIEYPHLISLDIHHVNPYYVECFLNETKIYLPRLTELTVDYVDLQDVTQNFTRLETQRNCARVRRLFLRHPTVHPEHFYRYFSSLSV